ncbi:EamA family transporter [Candidatus Woesearchaeota archaeon]|nr:EamA family transporter [Candidatus Woesearchaeota archaeon]
MQTELWAVFLVITGGIIGSFGPIFLKLGSAGLNKNLLSQFKNYKLILGILIYILSAAMFIPALKGGDLSLLYPLVSLSYVWVSLLSMFILKEKMNYTKWFGIFLILCGVSLIGLGSR